MLCRLARGFAFLSLMPLLARCGGSGGSTPHSPPDLLPFVQSTFPAHLAVGVPRTATVSARFSEHMDAFYIAFTPSFSLASGGGPVTGTITASPDGRDVQFTSATPLEYGTTYTATIDSGTLSSSGQALPADFTWTFTTEVEIVPPVAWSAPELIDDTAGIVLNGGYDIEIDNSGNAIAVWVRMDAGVRRVIASRSEAGGPWEDPTPIPGSEGAGTTAVADIGGSAEILVVWGAGDQLWASRAGTSGDWTDPEPVGDVLDEFPTPRHVFMDPDGNAVVIYHVAQFQAPNVYAIRYDAASEVWESVVDLSANYSADPAFSGEQSGTIVGVWPALDDNRIISRRYTPSGGWSGDVVLDPNLNDSPVYLPFVTLDGSGNAIAVWLRRIFGSPLWGAGMNDMFMSRMDSSGDWSELELVPVGPNALYPHFDVAALSPDGQAAITWRSSQRCWAIVQDSSGAWSAPAIVDNGPAQGDSQGFPFFSGEQVFVIGSSTTVAANWVWTNRYDPDDGWEGAELYRTTSGYLKGSTYLEMECAIDHTGGAAVFWKESTTVGAGGVVTLWAGRFPAP